MSEPFPAKEKAELQRKTKPEIRYDIIMPTLVVTPKVVTEAKFSTCSIDPTPTAIPKTVFVSQDIVEEPQ